MDNIRNGEIKIADSLTIIPGFSFSEFIKTRFSTGQDGVRVIYLDDTQIIDEKQYIVSLFLGRE